MTGADAITLNQSIDAWCASQQGAPAHFIGKAKTVRAQGCGRAYVVNRKYKLTSPNGELLLSVMGERVWLTANGRTREWTFRGMSAPDALAEFFKRMRPFLEPTGEVG